MIWQMIHARSLVASKMVRTRQYHSALLQPLGVVANIDGIWNLVLACDDCNRGPDGKFARVPELRFLQRLHDRNEFLIMSHHPLRDTLMTQTGATEPARRNYLQDAWTGGRSILIHTWRPAAEQNPGGSRSRWLL